MSHYIQRKENDCLNCRAVVYGRYCHLCGQENVEPKETFWHLVSHFVYDLTHFDGKFFSTVKYLLLKPGFLSREYIKGKRASYLNPIKMYVFISAFFFLFFFSIINPSFTNKEAKKNEVATRAEVKEDVEKEINEMEAEAREKGQPFATQKTLESKVQLLKQDLLTLQKDTTHLNNLNYYKLQENGLTNSNYKDVKDYDSVQNTLSPERRDSWLIKTGLRKALQLNSKYNSQDEFFEKLFEKFRHSFPQLLFVSLPLFALLLKMLYVRTKQFYYADYIIFSVHLYCAMFILMFIMISFSHFKENHYLTWFGYLTTPVVFYIIWYQYRSLRNFYEQNRGKTILKYFLLLLMSSVVMSLLFLIFLVFSVFNM